MPLFQYPQFCPLARAAEILGERWTLLLARELCLGPKRFSDLRHNLRPISSSVLTNRLATLEQRGLIAQRTLAPPAASVVYELTETGESLRPVLGELSRFGARFLLPPRGNEEYFDADWAFLAPESFARRGPSPARRFTLVVRGGDQVRHYLVEGGAAGTRVEERKASAGTTLHVDASLLPGLIGGFADLDEAEANGALVVDGDRSALPHFAALFEMDLGSATPPGVKPPAS